MNQGVANSLDQAVRLVEAGNPAAAEQVLRQVLARHPMHFDALQVLGIIKGMQGETAEAIRLLAKAVSVDAGVPHVQFNLARALSDAGRDAESLPHYEKAISLAPGQLDPYLGYAQSLERLGRLEQALAACDSAIRIEAGIPEVWYNRGNILKLLGRAGEALGSYERAIGLNPQFPQAWFNRGSALDELGRNEEALSSYEKGLAADPGNAPAWNSRGVVLRRLARLDDALASYDKAVAINPRYADAWSNRGNVLTDLGRHEEALASLDTALGIESRSASAWSNRGVALTRLARLREALESFATALDIEPAYAAAWTNRGIAQNELKQFEAAVASFDRALAINPGASEAWSGRASAMRGLKHHDEALAAFDKAVELDPSRASSWTNRGIALSELGRHAEALASHERALALEPASGESWSNRGIALLGLRCYADALQSFDKALGADPANAAAWHNRADALVELKQYGEALASRQRALSLKPDIEYAIGALAYVKAMLCDWSGLADIFRAIEEGANLGKRVAMPGAILVAPFGAELQRKCAEILVADRYPGEAQAGWSPARGAGRAGQRIRVGFVSGDFRDHPVGYQMHGLASLHDRSAFEFVGLSLRKADGDRYQEAMRNGFGQFHDLSDTGSGDAIALIRALDLDIAVDLQGHMHGARMELFARRVAPIQVNYLCPGTSGAPFLDYILADATVIPPAQHPGYTENVVALPDSFFVTDYRDMRLASPPSRHSQGLPDDGFVFACFCESYKLAPDIWRAWLRLLRALPGSVLWLGIRSGAAALENLRREAAAAGVSPDRLVSAKFTERRDDHLSRLALADLCLDTPIYNGHTTTADALWAGVPVLTSPGTAFSGRVAASILNAARLPDLVARDLEDYEATALRLATEPGDLAKLRARIAAGKASCPLFDTARAVRHVEAAFRMMVERQRKGLQAEAFAVEAS